jgi:hypothetical protein
LATDRLLHPQAERVHCQMNNSEPFCMLVPLVGVELTTFSLRMMG